MTVLNLDHQFENPGELSFDPEGFKAATLNRPCFKEGMGGELVRVGRNPQDIGFELPTSDGKILNVVPVSNLEKSARVNTHWVKKFVSMVLKETAEPGVYEEYIRPADQKRTKIRRLSSQSGYLVQGLLDEVTIAAHFPGSEIIALDKTNGVTVLGKPAPIDLLRNPEKSEGMPFTPQLQKALEAAGGEITFNKASPGADRLVICLPELHIPEIPIPNTIEIIKLHLGIKDLIEAISKAQGKDPNVIQLESFSGNLTQAQVDEIFPKDWIRFMNRGRLMEEAKKILDPKRTQPNFDPSKFVFFSRDEIAEILSDPKLSSIFLHDPEVIQFLQKAGSCFGLFITKIYPIEPKLYPSDGRPSEIPAELRGKAQNFKFWKEKFNKESEKSHPTIVNNFSRGLSSKSFGIIQYGNGHFTNGHLPAQLLNIPKTQVVVVTHKDLRDATEAINPTAQREKRPERSSATAEALENFSL